MTTAIPVPSRWCLVAAVATLAGVVLPRWMVLPAILALALGMRFVSPRALAVLSVLMVLGAMSGVAANHRSHQRFPVSPPSGRVEVTLRLTEDPTAAQRWDAIGQPRSLGGTDWNGPKLAVGPLPRTAMAGDTVTVIGTIRDRPRRMRDEQVAGTVHVDEVIDVQASNSPLFVVGNAIRERVRSVFVGPGTADALILGFLIGDTERLPARNLEDLRRSGLAHFVAVSGSNVAVFLGAWWLIGLPISVHPRLRALYGYVGLAVFVVVTRWEPSVVRAAVMAAVPLTGGLLGIPVDPWMALGVAVTMLLLVAGDLAFSVGFLLSVFATAGVLVGVALVSGKQPSWVWIPFGATMGAQAAVAPILLVVFGSIPLAAPLANLIAAPVVSLTTILGLVAVGAPVPVVTSLSRTGATVVLAVADRVADGPQLGWVGCAVVVGTLALVIARRSRPIGIAIVCVAALILATGPRPWPTDPTAVVLDIGQGDAILLLDPSGAAALIDGGREPAAIDRALRRHRISHLSVVVATHGDADHVGGLVEVVQTLPIDEVWIGRFVRPSSLLDGVIEAARTRSIPVRRVAMGDVGAVGRISLTVLGPQRRYATDNDGSVVLLAAAERTMLLAGDIEAVAQRELAELHPDVMVVPHHGSGTTDRRWLEATVGDEAILSYGPNTYGHPHPDIVALLRDLGTDVRSTAEDGDISVPLG